MRGVRSERNTCIRFLIRMSWWSWSGSNRRPPPCKGGAPPAELQPRESGMVGLGGFEPPTSRLSAVRSNQLSYRPENRSVQISRCSDRPPRTDPYVASNDEGRNTEN